MTHDSWKKACKAKTVNWKEFHTNYQKAVKYFDLQKGYVLHHLFPQDDDYELWDIKKLQPMTKEEHIAFHALGRAHTKEHKKHISQLMRKRTFSEETRRKMSESAKKRVREPMSQETKEKIGEANRKKIRTSVSAETRIKMSKAHKAYARTEKGKLQLAYALSSRPPERNFTEEGLKSISEKAKRRWAEGVYNNSVEETRENPKVKRDKLTGRFLKKEGI